MKRNYIVCMGLLAFIFFAPLKAQDADYEFVGHHFFASMLGCDKEALINVDQLAKALENASEASGAKILSSSRYTFPGNGFTMVILLSESHASIHTYPEFGACFIDLFTCGHNCSARKFEAVLEEYLKPQEVDKRMLHRSSKTLDEEPF